MDGYNVCIFAYGQTGSGKAYTMNGPDNTTDETWGVNYRALRDLFDISKSRTSVMTYDVSVQMIKIYNEQLRDLLVSDGSNRRLEIQNNSQLNGLNIPNASFVSVNCTQDVLDLMKIGHGNCVVGATALNALGGHAKTLMFVHINPELNSFGEMISTLKFAERVASIELGAGRANKESGDVRDLKEEISKLKSALEAKESEVARMKKYTSRRPRNLI